MSVDAPLPWMPILMYHRIVEGPETDPDRVCTLRSRLRAHLLRLAGGGFAPVPLDLALVPPQPAEGRRYALTFDDAYTSTLELALPVLEELRVPASMFVVSGALGGRSAWNRVPADGWPLMSAEQVRRWHEAGFFVGSHGLSHRRLTTLGDRELREELHGSKASLEDLVGAEVRFFAYPHHAADRRVREAVAEAGYAGAVGGRDGRHGRFNLHRVQAEWMGEAKLALHVRGAVRLARALPLPGPARRLAGRFV